VYVLRVRTAPGCSNSALYFLYLKPVEVVTTSEVLKDGTSVKQMLIDTYAEKEKNEEEKRATISTSEAEQDTLDDIKHGPKYQTGFFLQVELPSPLSLCSSSHETLSAPV